MQVATKRVIATAAGLALTLSVSSTSLAHYCTNEKKPVGAGSAGTYDIATDTFTPSKSGHGDFVTITDGSTFAVDVYGNVLLPEGAQNAGPGDSECDGKGNGDALDCLGVEE